MAAEASSTSTGRADLSRTKVTDWPWGVWTANGKHCQAWISPADWEIIRGKRVTYGCAGGGRLLGFVDVRKSVWTIDYTPRDELRARVVRIGITDAWRVTASYCLGC